MRRAIIAINIIMLAIITSTITGCGLTQKVSEGTIALTESIFYKQIKTLHLDIVARQAANKNAQGVALSTVVRIYQLKDRKAFDSASYQLLFAEDSTIVKADLLSQKDIRVRPGENITLNIPMEPEAQYIAIAGMFISPDLSENTWRKVMTFDDLDPDTARIIELDSQAITLVPLQDD
ncbi:type VI secretion system lipoprotein TssJ [Enterobacter sp.]|uniref:type VI secretion system lipoprotein TssJ n=1 Tax=Enterobacter sp. TaxID=42895 RepID=UPI00296E9184|nr:type VI secretion system lipoprotein TssJ [Enterobacter sp.]